MIILNYERLDKIIASQLNISRSDAKKGIKQGQALVNSNIVRNFGFLINTEKDIVCFKNVTINYKRYIYLIMNKPKDILSVSNDKKVKTVIDIVPDNLKRSGLFPVGRLDKNTTGLLLITDDGDFAHRVIAPKKHVSKVYIALLDGEVTDEMCVKFNDGIVLEDGTKCSPADLEKLDGNYAKVTIHEGKYHQIKRMFGVVGLGVNELDRISIGELTMPKDLNQGETRELSENEKIRIFIQK